MTTPRSTRRSPGSIPPTSTAIARFLDYSAGVYHEGYEKLGAVPFLDFKSMLRAAPQLARYQAWRSVYSIVSGFVRNEKLRQALVLPHPARRRQSDDDERDLRADPQARARRRRLVRQGRHQRSGRAAWCAHFERLGGTIRLGDPVEAIESDGARVTGGPDEERLARRVRRGRHQRRRRPQLRTCSRAIARGPAAAARLRRKRFSPSLFVVHFGVRGNYPDVPHHNILFGPRYRALLGDIYDHGRLPDDPSLYLHHPTATDSEHGAGGHARPSTRWRRCRTSASCRSTGRRRRRPIADRILAIVEQRLLPDLRERIEIQFHYTPQDFADDLGAHLGSAFSLEPLLTQSAWFRTHNRDDAIPNLYFVGAGTHPGAGIPGVVGSAKATAGLMIDDLTVLNGARWWPRPSA